MNKKNRSAGAGIRIALAVWFMFAGCIQYVSAETAETSLDYFRFREGTLEWQITNRNIDPKTQKVYQTKCYGHTLYIDPKGRGLIDDIDGEFTGLVPMSPMDADGISKGSKKITISSVPMRYEIDCGAFSKKINVDLYNWPSDQKIRAFPSLKNKKTLPASLPLKYNGKEATAIRVTSPTKGFSPRAGQTQVPVGSAVVVIDGPIRLTQLSLSSPTFKKNGPKGILKNIHILIDNKALDSFDMFGGDGTVSWSGLGLALAEKLSAGKHTLTVVADISNPPEKNKIKPFLDKLTLSSMNALTGPAHKLKLKNPLSLGTYTVYHDPKRSAYTP